jgi:hypothetical protein
MAGIMVVEFIFRACLKKAEGPQSYPWILQKETPAKNLGTKSPTPGHSDLAG